MQTDNREVTEGGGQNRSRGPLVGIATAAVILIAGLVLFLTRDNTPVAEPAPNATELTGELSAARPRRLLHRRRRQRGDDYSWHVRHRR